jgi:hypothetical protein
MKQYCAGIKYHKISLKYDMLHYIIGWRTMLYVRYILVFANPSRTKLVYLRMWLCVVGWVVVDTWGKLGTSHPVMQPVTQWCNITSQRNWNYILNWINSSWKGRQQVRLKRHTEWSKPEYLYVRCILFHMYVCQGWPSDS